MTRQTHTTDPVAAPESTRPRAGRRAGTVLLTVAVAGGLAAGGYGIASAATGAPTAGPTASATGVPTAGPSGASAAPSGAPAAPSGAPAAPSGGPAAPMAPPAGPGAAARTPHLDGTVTAVGSDSITIRDHDGFTRTIVTSSDTTYTKDGASASGSAVVEGVHVMASGSVDDNGTSLDATRVDVVTKAPSPPAGGPGAARGPAAPGGPGAPSGRGPAAGAAQGAPSVSGDSSSGTGSNESSAPLPTAGS